MATAGRRAGISYATYYNWWKQFGGMGRLQLPEMKGLEKENSRLKKIVAELELDKLILKKSLTLSEAKVFTTEELRQAIIHTRQKLTTSERRTCRVIGLVRSFLQY